VPQVISSEETEKEQEKTAKILLEIEKILTSKRLLAHQDPSIPSKAVFVES
jgi:hypothetical protein